MDKLCETEDGINYPSVAYCEGGIHEAIMAYEDSAFFEILAEEMANKDMNHVPITEENFDEFADLMCDYIAEFEKNGTDNLLLDK